VVPFLPFLPAEDEAGDEHGRLAKVVLVEPVLVVLWLRGGCSRGGRGVQALCAGHRRRGCRTT